MSICVSVKSFQQNLQKLLFVKFICSERAMYMQVCIDFSAVASFPASLCNSEGLEKRVVWQWASCLILSSNKSFFCPEKLMKKHFCTSKKFPTDF